MTPIELECEIKAAKAYENYERLQFLNALPYSSLNFENILKNYNNDRKSLSLSIDFALGIKPPQKEIDKNWRLFRGGKTVKNDG